MRAVLVWGGGAILALYPIVMYFGLQTVEPSLLASVMIAIIIARFTLVRRSKTIVPWMKGIPVVATGALLISIGFNNTLGIKLYPLVINAGMLVIFGVSLYKGPPVIETLARLQEPNLDTNGIAYTRTVTKIWCWFFLINMSISAYTAWFTSMATWTLYNGFIAYLAMGLLFVIEWIVRQRVRQH